MKPNRRILLTILENQIIIMKVLYGIGINVGMSKTRRDRKHLWRTVGYLRKRIRRSCGVIKGLVCKMDVGEDGQRQA